MSGSVLSRLVAGPLPRTPVPAPRVEAGSIQPSPPERAPAVDRPLVVAQPDTAPAHTVEPEVGSPLAPREVRPAIRGEREAPRRLEEPTDRFAPGAQVQARASRVAPPLAPGRTVEREARSSDQPLVIRERAQERGQEAMLTRAPLVVLPPVESPTHGGSERAARPMVREVTPRRVPTGVAPPSEARQGGSVHVEPAVRVRGPEDVSLPAREPAPLTVPARERALSNPLVVRAPERASRPASPGVERRPSPEAVAPSPAGVPSRQGEERGRPEAAVSQVPVPAPAGSRRKSSPPLVAGPARENEKRSRNAPVAEPARENEKRSRNVRVAEPARENEQRARVGKTQALAPARPVRAAASPAKAAPVMPRHEARASMDRSASPAQAARSRQAGRPTVAIAIGTLEIREKQAPTAHPVAAVPPRSHEIDPGLPFGGSASGRW